MADDGIVLEFNSGCHDQFMMCDMLSVLSRISTVVLTTAKVMCSCAFYNFFFSSQMLSEGQFVLFFVVLFTYFALFSFLIAEV